MFVETLQRRAFGVELWAVTPSHDTARRTYFVRFYRDGHLDRHFGELPEALDEFFRRVREAVVDNPASAVNQFDADRRALPH